MNGEQVVAATPDAAFAVNSEGRLIAWNEAASRCLGQRDSEVVGRRCWKVLQGRDLSRQRDCGRDCPYLALQREPVNRAQLLFRPIDRTELRFGCAPAEANRFAMSTFLVQGEDGAKDIVHIFQAMPL